MSCNWLEESRESVEVVRGQSEVRRMVAGRMREEMRGRGVCP